MARPVVLFSGPWADLPLEELAPRASEWGYQGLDLACWGDHFEVQRALSEADYCQRKLDLLARHDLMAVALSNHRVGQAVGDPIVPHHRALLPEYVWGDGDPVAVPQRATTDTVGQVPAKIFDAMALARPVVSTSVSMIPEILDGCGVVVPPDDPPALAAALARLLATPAEARAMGLRARARCEEQYSFRAARARLFPLFERLG